MDKKKLLKNVKNRSKNAVHTDTTIKQQYEVIRKDVIKLRDDLVKGYDMARSMVDKKNIQKLLNSK